MGDFGAAIGKEQNNLARFSQAYGKSTLQSGTHFFAYKM
jgi:hypothetical protein